MQNIYTLYFIKKIIYLNLKKLVIDNRLKVKEKYMFRIKGCVIISWDTQGNWYVIYMNSYIILINHSHVQLKRKYIRFN